MPTTADVDILLGTGTGTFGSATTFDTMLSTPSSLAFADFNSDQTPDLVIGSNAGVGGGAQVLINQSTVGKPSLVPGQKLTTRAITGVAAGNVDAQALPDIVLSE